MSNYTEARKNGNRKWDAANLDRISVALPKGSKEAIKSHADARGESVNGFINRAISETIERDKEEDEMTVEEAAMRLGVELEI